MKIKVSLSDLSLDTRRETEKPSGGRGRGTAVKSVKSMAVSPELDLRGSLADEAIERCSKYLDDAFLAGLKRVTIIHGKGTGVLRSAVQSYLRNHPHVGSYRLGEFGEGDSGVTVVEIKA